MPRKPGVYRNVKRCEVVALIVKLNDGVTYVDTFLTPYFKDKQSALKYLQKEYDSKKIKVVKIQKMVEKEVSYFLSIENYLKYAVEVEKEGK